VAKSFLAKFVYNNSVYNTTGISPFFAIYGFYLNISLSVKDDYLERKIPAAKKKVKEFEYEGKELAERWRHAVKFQKKWYNKKYTLIYFFIGDWVMLTSIYLR
jgi:hypothetical protein